MRKPAHPVLPIRAADALDLCLHGSVPRGKGGGTAATRVVPKAAGSSAEPGCIRAIGVPLAHGSEGVRQFARITRLAMSDVVAGLRARLGGADLRSRDIQLPSVLPCIDVSVHAVVEVQWIARMRDIVAQHMVSLTDGGLPVHGALQVHILAVGAPVQESQALDVERLSVPERMGLVHHGLDRSM